MVPVPLRSLARRLELLGQRGVPLGGVLDRPAHAGFSIAFARSPS
jgi:hypothetical protein